MANRHEKSRLTRWLQRLFSSRDTRPPEIVQATRLIAAVDAGGVPLFPAKINLIARNLGLEVSSKAPVDETLQRIRAALRRA